MIEELREIDTSSVESLRRLQQSRSRLEKLVAKAEERKTAVSPEIYARVTGDYAKRLDEVEAEARPLREKARAELARLMTLHERLEAALAQARLDQEELEFRHALGELEEQPYAVRREAMAGAVERCTKDFEGAEGLRGRFVEVLPAEPEPAPSLPEPELPPPPPIAEMTMPVTPPPPPPATSEGTQLVRRARLVLVRTDGSEHVYSLGPAARIGRTRQNDIMIESSGVSRQHAQVSLEGGGYVIRDLGSNNGTWVNDERVATPRPLVHGDKVAIGNQTFRFEHP